MKYVQWDFVRKARFWRYGFVIYVRLEIRVNSHRFRSTMLADRVADNVKEYVG